MKKLTAFKYQDQIISFDFKGKDKMINATEMAKPFGKRAHNFLAIEQTKSFIEKMHEYLEEPFQDSRSMDSCSENLGAGQYSEKIIKVINGGRSMGTWMRDRLALKFAAWLSPEFELWVFDRIFELLTQGYTVAGGWDCVYFLYSPKLNLVKIGKTTNLRNRMSTIQAHCSDQLVLLQAVSTQQAGELEQTIHQQFDKLRTHGE